MGGTKTKPICQKAGDIKLTPVMFEADMGEWVVRIESYDINGKPCYFFVWSAIEHVFTELKA